MTSEKSSYPGGWLRIAQKDLRRVERALRDRDAEVAGFFLQQAVEKFLKAFLLARGWKLRRIHDLEALLDDAVVYDAALEQFRGVCQRITKYYMLGRYPLPIESQVTIAEVGRSLAGAQELVARLRETARH